MKTDPFDEAIRRKLESIEPPFREKSWTQMQAFMRQHGFPPAWYGVSQWLLPVAASVVLVALVATNVWQYRTNKQLVQTVQTLKETVARLEKQSIAPQSGEQKSVAPLRDTVYVAQYVETPTPTRRPSAPEAISPGETAAPVPPSELTRRAEKMKPEETAERQDEISEKQRIETAGAGSKAKLPAETLDRETNAQPQRERLFSPKNTEAAAAATGPGKRTPLVGNTTPRSGDEVTAIRRENRSVGENTLFRPGQPAAPIGVVGPATPTNKSALGAMALQPLSSLAIPRDSVYFPDWMARRARKIRSLLPQAAGIAATPTANEPAISAMPNRTRFGLGASGELAVGQWSAGIYGEVRVAGNWLLGVGLNRLSLSGGQFLTDELFDAKTKRDFRREYAFGIDPRQEILNIDRRSYTWQVPLSVGYRLGLTEGLALIPSVGATFSLTAREQTTFTYRRGPREFLGAEYQKDRPTEWYNNYTLAVAVEKQWNHFAVQAGPFVTGPFRATPEQINTPSIGLRSRLLFRF